MGACNSQFPFKRKKEQSNEQYGGECGDEENGRKCKLNSDSNLELQCDLNGKPALDNPSNGTSSNSLHSFSSANFDEDKLLSIHDLYNILNDSGIRPYIHDPSNFLLIDSRESECYSASHVITAKQHIKFMSSTKNRESLTKYAVIVIYGNEIRNDKPSQELLKLMHKIEEYVPSDILVLRDGFGLFYKKFPYLCTDQEIESVADRKLLLCYPSTVIDELLYQGRGDQATNEKIIDTLGITHIVNISEHKNAFPSKIKYLKLPLEDMVTTNLLQHFHRTSAFIKDALSNNGCVLIHCNLGVSRSSTITLAYLMKCRKWKLDYAYRFLKARRTCSSPNSGFLKQLSEWESELFEEKHTDIECLLTTHLSNKR